MNIPEFEKPLVPNFNRVLPGGKDFTEWFNEPEQLKTRATIIANIKRENQEYCDRLDKRIIDILMEDFKNETRLV